jgi:flavin reductase (DIM6/NTAB) family NADH-FMN oxidoreductase RutF
MKKTVGPKNILYPMPVVLIGALVNGVANYMPMAHVGILDFSTISLGMGKMHYTASGIKENRAFSVNLPSIDMVKETDHCGLVSGMHVDKSPLFEPFFGTLTTAPMIRECPLNMECRVTQILDFPKHDIVIGEIVQTYCDEEVLTDGELDYTKIRPILFTMAGHGFWKLGERFATAWEVGKEFKG